ncbi:MAG: ROK family transcriptional regulator [Clostridiales bacterium]|nr:ROK family transcriptional regulator [Clostridiales bacterium]
MNFKIKSANNIDVKATNKSNIKKLIYNQRNLTKQEIANTLKLSMPTVMQNIKVLKSEGLLEEYGTLESSGGRKPQLVHFNYNAKKSIGITISRNHIRIVIINLENQIQYDKKFHSIFESIEEYWTRLNSQLLQILKEENIKLKDVLGIGFALPGSINSRLGRLEFAPTIMLKNFDLHELETYFDLPVIFENEANAAGFAEVWCREILNDAIYLSITKGVGGAVILDNTIFHGKNGYCGEFGHTIIYQKGTECSCGKLGCLEAYCSVNALVKDYDGDLDEFFEEVKKGSKKEVIVWEEYLNNLALGIHNLKMTFDLDIIIGGEISGFLINDIESLNKKVMSLLQLEEDVTFIRISQLGENASALGGALMIVSSFLDEV